MHSIEKLFAVVDRKVDAFDFSIKKVKGKVTGNEYYAVSAACIIYGEEFVKRILTIGCPGKAIEAIVKAITSGFGQAPMPVVEAAPGLKKVEEAPKVTLRVHQDVAEEIVPGLRKIAPVITSEPEEEVNEEDFEMICEECGEPLDECTCGDDEEECDDNEEETPTVRVTLIPSAPATGNAHDCQYCGAKVAPNFVYCPMCGGQQ